MLRASGWLCVAVLGLGACRVQEPAQNPQQAAVADAAPARPQPVELGNVKKEAMAASIAADTAKNPPPSIKPATQACATDTDCYALANYCGGCTCEVSNAKEPSKCKQEERVACFADPCLNQKATCNQGRCQLIGAQAPVER